jgi:Na+/H+ antiporter NhaA
VLARRGGRAAQTQARGGAWLGQLSGPLRRFLDTEASSATLMLAATVLALVWANSPWSAQYASLWSAQASLALAEWERSMDLRHWVNDGLMALFFFVIGLEVRREISIGELTERRRAAIPVVAALGGLAAPAVLYLAIAPSGEAARGWGSSSAPTRHSCWER